MCHEQQKGICRYHSGEKTASPRFDGDGKGDLQTDVAENHGALITTMKECQYTWLERMGKIYKWNEVGYESEIGCRLSENAHIRFGS